MTSFESSLSSPVSDALGRSSDDSFWNEIERLSESLANLQKLNKSTSDYLNDALHHFGFNNLTSNLASFESILNELETVKEEDICFHGTQNGGHHCTNRFLHKLLAGYMYPVLLLVCLVGNSLNIAVYSIEFMRKSIAVKILAARATTNCLFVLLLMFKAAKTLELWDPKTNKGLEGTYWHLWPYVVMIANIFGSSAMWITVLMTLERFLYVIYPLQSKQWCTNRNLFWALVLIILSSFFLQFPYPITHYIEVKNCTKTSHVVYLFMSRPEKIYKILEQVQHLANVIFAAFIPMLAMSVMSVTITWRLLCHGGSAHHHSRGKRCITMITLSTTVTHLILESPQVVVLMQMTVGANRQDESFCNWIIISNFLGTCNASLLFFIYLGCSEHFRDLLMTRLGCQTADSRCSSRNPFFERNCNKRNNERVTESTPLLEVSKGGKRKQRNGSQGSLSVVVEKDEIGTEKTVTYSMSNTKYYCT